MKQKKLHAFFADLCILKTVFISLRSLQTFKRYAHAIALRRNIQVDSSLSLSWLGTTKQDFAPLPIFTIYRTVCTSGGSADIAITHSLDKVTEVIP